MYDFVYDLFPYALPSRTPTVHLLTAWFRRCPANVGMTQEVKVLMACHEENPYGKFFGACNDLKVALDSCFVVSSNSCR